MDNAHTPLDEMPPVTAWLSDMDGVLVKENRALPGAQQFLDALKRNEMPFLVLTNNSIFTNRDLSARLKRSGLSVPEERIWTSANATAAFLLSGLAGVTFTLANINMFQEKMTNGTGFIAVALVYFSGWKPKGVLAGALLFSFVNAFQLRMQVLGIEIPSDIAMMLPYLLTILTLVFVKSRDKPAALAVPYERSEN